MSGSPLPSSPSLGLEDLPLEPLLARYHAAGERTAHHHRLRARFGPVAPVDLLGEPVWLVLGYPESLRVLTDESLWKKNLRWWRRYAEGRVPPDWPLLPALECDMVVFFDDQRRAAARATLEAAIEPFQSLASPLARRLRERTVRHADELLDAVADGRARGRADLAGQYARPLPLLVANHLLGFPVARSDEIVMELWRVLDGGPQGPAAIERLMDTLRRLVRLKRAEPGDDVPSYLVRHDPTVADEELAWQLYLVLVATADNAGALLENTLVEALTTDTARHSSLQVGYYGEVVNRAAIANPPVHNLTFRFPVAPTPLGRFTVAAGDPVLVSTAAAHRCPHFAVGDPAATGPAFSSRAHLAFGAGPHRCPAQDLAFMVVEVGIERLFARFAALELTMPADQLPWRVSPWFSGLRALPVRYEVGGPGGRGGGRGGAGVS